MRLVEFQGREDKLTLVGDLFFSYLRGSVLDVGCDRRYLSRFVTGAYIGVDIAGEPDIKVNLEDGLPFRNKSFDTVVAFDVLEHLDNIYFVFDELCRIAKNYIILSLPNMYEWRFRLMFLLGKRISGKYGLPIEPPPDRHRWLFSFNEASHFVQERSRRMGFRVRDEVIGY